MRLQVKALHQEHDQRRGESFPFRPGPWMSSAVGQLKIDTSWPGHRVRRSPETKGPEVIKTQDRKGQKVLQSESYTIIHTSSHLNYRTHMPILTYSYTAVKPLSSFPFPPSHIDWRRNTPYKILLPHIERKLLLAPSSPYFCSTSKITLAISQQRRSEG